MSALVALDCDVCSEVITAAPTAAAARDEAKLVGYHTALPGGRDICDLCWKEGYRVIRDDDGSWVLFRTGRRKTSDSGSDS